MIFLTMSVGLVVMTREKAASPISIVRGEMAFFLGETAMGAAHPTHQVHHLLRHLLRHLLHRRQVHQTLRRHRQGMVRAELDILETDSGPRTARVKSSGHL